MTVVLLVRLIGTGSFPRTLHLGENTRRIATYAGVILITDGAFTLFNQVDVLVIGGYLSTSAVGIFSAPLRLTVRRLVSGPDGVHASFDIVEPGTSASCYVPTEGGNAFDPGK